MEVKKGYKLTEVGLIPADWHVRGLSQCAIVQSGVAKNSNIKISDPIRVHYLRVANVQDGYLDLSEMSEIEISKSDLRRFAVLPGDVLMNEGGDRDKLGRGTVWSGEYSPCIHQNHVFVVRCRSEIAPRFLTAWTRSSFARQYFVTAGSQTTNLASINKSALGKLPIAIPPTLAEQEAIANALVDADAWIESLEQLIAKKRRIKQGAMQELLTGKRRLPGFSGEWEVKRLGELGVFLKGCGVTKSQTMSGELPCVRYGEIYTRHDDYIRNFYSWISRDIALIATPLRRGDILFAGSGETKDEIGKCVAFIHDCEAYAGGDIVILRTSNFDPLFLGYFLNTTDIARQKASRGQGDAVVHISALALSSIVGRFPKPEEQTAIATILSDMDSEISALETKLAKARQIKQGMMQELLTGRIRLV